MSPCMIPFSQPNATRLNLVAPCCDRFWFPEPGPYLRSGYANLQADIP